jgi:hypothetical protein
MSSRFDRVYNGETTVFAEIASVIYSVEYGTGLGHDADLAKLETDLEAATGAQFSIIRNSSGQMAIACSADCDVSIPPSLSEFWGWSPALTISLVASVPQVSATPDNWLDLSASYALPVYAPLMELVHGRAPVLWDSRYYLDVMATWRLTDSDAFDVRRESSVLHVDSGSPLYAWADATWHTILLTPTQDQANRQLLSDGTVRIWREKVRFRL